MYRASDTLRSIPPATPISHVKSNTSVMYLSASAITYARVLLAALIMHTSDPVPARVEAL